jgi:hypothetical protein
VFWLAQLESELAEETAKIKHEESIFRFQVTMQEPKSNRTVIVEIRQCWIAVFTDFAPAGQSLWMRAAPDTSFS